MQSSPSSFAEYSRRASGLVTPKEKKVIITDTYFHRGVEMADHLRQKFTRDVTLMMADRRNQFALDNLRREFQVSLNRALKHYDPARQDITVIMNYFTSVQGQVWEILRQAEDRIAPVRKILVSCEDQDKFPFMATEKGRARHISYHDDRSDYLELLDGQLGI